MQPCAQEANIAVLKENIKHISEKVVSIKDDLEGINKDVKTLLILKWQIIGGVTVLVTILSVGINFIEKVLAK